MKKSKKKREKEQAALNRILYGVHVCIDDGEEDTTIRPSDLPPQTLSAMKEDCPPPEFYSDPLNYKPKTKGERNRRRRINAGRSPRPTLRKKE